MTARPQDTLLAAVTPARPFLARRLPARIAAHGRPA